MTRVTSRAKEPSSLDIKHMPAPMKLPGSRPSNKRQETKTYSHERTINYWNLCKYSRCRHIAAILGKEHGDTRVAEI